MFLCLSNSVADVRSPGYRIKEENYGAVVGSMGTAESRERGHNLERWQAVPGRGLAITS